jgi:hypothetical protein
LQAIMTVPSLRGAQSSASPQASWSLTLEEPAFDDKNAVHRSHAAGNGEALRRASA